VVLIFTADTRSLSGLSNGTRDHSRHQLEDNLTGLIRGEGSINAVELLVLKTTNPDGGKLTLRVTGFVGALHRQEF
jgi:hypothetical protein